MLFKKLILKFQQLFSIISNKKTKVELLKDKDISEEYLTILLRELKSIQSKPLKLSEFNWISQDVIKNLKRKAFQIQKFCTKDLAGHVIERNS